MDLSAVRKKKCSTLNVLVIIIIIIIIIVITGHHSRLLQAKDGKAKKSKQENIELFELPRTQSLLGSCHVALSSLLEGEHEIESECVCEGGEGNEKIDKKEEGPGIKSDASDKKKSNKGGH